MGNRVVNDASCFRSGQLVDTGAVCADRWSRNRAALLGREVEIWRCGIYVACQDNQLDTICDEPAVPGSRLPTFILKSIPSERAAAPSKTQLICF